MEYESLTRTMPPTVEPVTLADAKGHLRVDTDTDDGYILGLIAAAREWCEAYLDRTLIHTQWTMRLEAFPSDDEAVSLPRPPVAVAAGNTAVSVSYTLSGGSTAALSTASYSVNRYKTPGEVTADSWPITDGEATVTWWAGYGAAPSDVPATIRHAMLMLIGTWYERRASADSAGGSEVPFGVRSLLDSARHFR